MDIYRLPLFIGTNFKYAYYSGYQNGVYSYVGSDIWSFYLNWKDVMADYEGNCPNETPAYLECVV
jgi:superoxide dismutase